MATILRDALLIDGLGGPPQPHAALAFEGGRITAVGPVDAVRPAPGDRVVDLDGRTVMPGLIDAHTHLTYHSAQPNVWTQELAESLELNTLRAAANARAILHCGFTTIGDGGCRGFIGPAIRDAVEAGLIEGPRIVSAGAIICGEAGLLDNVPPWAETRNPTSLGMQVAGVEQVRSAVRRQVKGGVDWIKVAASGVAGSRWSSAEHDDLGYEEIRAAVEEAAKYRRPVHAHAHSTGGIRAALEAGAISLHSGEFADQASMEAMRDRGVRFSPTIAWLHVRCIPAFGAPRDPEFRDQAWRAFDAARRMIPEARAIGARLALGTDAAHRFPHVPDGVIEMEYLVALGFTPLEAIGAATAEAAAAIGRAESLGTLRPGLAADLLVVDGNPAEDIGILRDKARIAMMFKGGTEVALPAGRGRIGVPFDIAAWMAMDFGALGAA
ncbi:amidohydrolase family protein [Falsiroseomonas sp. CW058]|uniref:amidohydrolase family protein n=1 Tax=Falsiroseomonas sp. CW058 TaxID=3388664 RepID=UPI003D3198FC